MLVALWEPREDRFTFCNAGSEPPLICRHGEMLNLPIEGVPIGLLDDRRYEEVVYQTESGDAILFFSDGVADQLNAKEEEFSRQRVVRLLKKHAKESPAAIASAVFKELDAFRGSTTITDDQSVVVMKVL
jgi:sigma-B regulation protein RsbU (phosphoserine phosphatase)